MNSSFNGSILIAIRNAHDVRPSIRSFPEVGVGDRNWYERKYTESTRSRLPRSFDAQGEGREGRRHADNVIAFSSIAIPMTSDTRVLQQNGNETDRNVREREREGGRKFYLTLGRRGKIHSWQRAEGVWVVTY